MSEKTEVEDKHENDKAFAAGWNSKTLAENPYHHASPHALVFVEGWVMRMKIRRLGLAL